MAETMKASKTAEGIRLIQEDFQKRFGVKANVDIFVFDNPTNQIDRKLADYICKQNEEAFGKQTEHFVRNKTAWGEINNYKSDIKLTVFYPGEEYVELGAFLSEE